MNKEKMEVLEELLEESFLFGYEIGGATNNESFHSIIRRYCISQEAAIEAAKKEIKELVKDTKYTSISAEVGYIEFKKGVPSDFYDIYCWESDWEGGIEACREGDKEIVF